MCTSTNQEEMTIRHKEITWKLIIGRGAERKFIEHHIEISSCNVWVNSMC